LASVIYASTLGVFANNGVEYFTPWGWNTGLWEIMHLFSRYAKGYSVSSTSSLENTVSAYTTVNSTTDSMTVIIVNRDIKSAHNVTVNINGFSVNNDTYRTLQLASLPANETFISNSKNALKYNIVTVNSNSFSISVPALSTTAVLLPTRTTGTRELKYESNEMKVYPNPASDILNLSIASNVSEKTQIIVFDRIGRKLMNSFVQYDGYSPITVNLASLQNGFYFITVRNSQCISTKSFTVNK